MSQIDQFKKFSYQQTLCKQINSQKKKEWTFNECDSLTSSWHGIKINQIYCSNIFILLGQSFTNKNDAEVLFVFFYAQQS